MPQIVNKKSVLEMAMGAIAEITDYEVERVVANIMDPNTNATAYDNETKHHIAYVEAETDDGCDWNESEE